MALEGNFQVVSPAGVIQLVCLERRTAHLRVQEGTRAGGLYFVDGEVVHAEFDGLEGEPAFIRIVQVEGGNFTLEDGAAAPRRTVNRPAQFLLLEASRRQDEDARTEADGLVSLTRALLEQGLARGFILVGRDGFLHSRHQMADAEARARLIARLLPEAEAIGGALRLGALRRAWLYAAEGRAFAVAPYGARWVGVEAKGGPAGGRLAAALDRALPGGGGSAGE
jgi:hypothetical protein